MRIIWATTEAGKPQPLDAQSNPLGSVMAYHDVTGWQARSIAGGTETRHPLERTYMPHVVTCRGTPNVEDPPEPPSTER